MQRIDGGFTTTHRNKAPPTRRSLQEALFPFKSGRSEPYAVAVSGLGFLGSGSAMSAQVANNTLYVSATSGVPSIKVAGMAHAL